MTPQNQIQTEIDKTRIEISDILKAFHAKTGCYIKEIELLHHYSSFRYKKTIIVKLPVSFS